MNEEPIFPEELLAKIAAVPTAPGIYQYFNEQGKIIYIGKAKNLRNRVRTYFHSFHSHNEKTKALVSNIANIEIIIVDSEAEALMLEDNLIKKHKPRYNIMLRDDKTYPYIRITNEPFPRIFITRNVVKDGSKYLGPFTEIHNIKYMLNSVRNIFQIRSCKFPLTLDSIAHKKYRSCLDCHIGKCQAPCVSEISVEEYANNVKMAQQVLLGKTKMLANELERQMQQYSENMEFEKAATARNRLQSLGNFTSKQKVISPELQDRDIFGIARNGDFACTLVFVVREGKLIGKRHFIVTKAQIETDEEILQRTIEKYYLETDFVPKEIILPNEVEQLEYLLDWLGKKRLNNWTAYFENTLLPEDADVDELKDQVGNLRADSISVKFPKIGDKRKLVEMANNNAEFQLQEYINSLDKRDKAVPHSLLSLQRDLNLSKPPIRIECYDNSHLQGVDMVSSMVVFIDGKPKKSEYRKFKAKDEDESKQFHNDDFAMMRQTIYRRFKRAVDEQQPLPDLVIVDGGKGQLSSAYGILQELDLADKIAIIGLAKRLEEVFKPNVSDSIMLPKTSSSLKLIQQLRDEAHRFAITFNRELRRKHSIESELDEIKGIGNVTINKLLDKFGTVQGVKNATDAELESVLNKRQIEELKKHFTT
ncbi:MAG: excinuclease ABC subunit UvrC [Ignavibacteria bacterium]|jgi:excinuclease ABC subunit C|nr:excinuclease ABC subunit UvrC [Ignavibacteria bacterium]